MEEKLLELQKRIETLEQSNKQLIARLFTLESKPHNFTIGPKKGYSWIEQDENGY